MQQSSAAIFQVIQNLQSNLNEVRTQAETTLKQMRAEQARALFSGLVEVIESAGNPELKPITCLLLKKYYLDGRAEEESLEQLTLDDISALKQRIKGTLNFEAEPMNLLRRKAEIICKLHKKEESYGELVQQMGQLAGQEASNADSIVKGKQFAMYMFELLSEYHLPQEQIVANSNHFMLLFSQSLKDVSVKVRTATLKAMICFLTSIEDEEEVLKYQAIMDLCLDVVIEVLKTDEEEGCQSLESLIELTQSYAEIWTSCIGKLLFVCSEIMRTVSFESSSRQSALEIISTMAEANPKMLRD